MRGAYQNRRLQFRDLATTSPPDAPALSPRAALHEALAVWALAFGGLVLTKVAGFGIPFLAGQVKAVAAVLFLYLPGYRLRKRDEEIDDYAVPQWPWSSRVAARQFRRDALWGLGVCAILVPLAVVGFFAFLKILAWLPPELRAHLAPYRSGAFGGEVALRFPDQLWLHILDQFLVVSLPEEFFYRGYLQTLLTRAFGPGKLRVLGANLGWAFLATQLLFAFGHLAELHVWRLGVFFPALLFGWLRERTGSIVPGIIVHAISNLLIMTLEASVFGKR